MVFKIIFNWNNFWQQYIFWVKSDTIVPIVVVDVMIIQNMFPDGTRPFNLGSFEISSFLGKSRGGSLPPECWDLLEFFQNKYKIESVHLKVTFLFELWCSISLIILIFWCAEALIRKQTNFIRGKAGFRILEFFNLILIFLHSNISAAVEQCRLIFKVDWSSFKNIFELIPITSDIKFLTGPDAIVLIVVNVVMFNQKMFLDVRHSFSLRGFKIPSFLDTRNGRLEFLVNI